MKLLVLVFALIYLSQGGVPFLQAEGPVVEGSYLITFSNNATAAQTDGILSQTEVLRVYSNLPNFKVWNVKMTDEQLQAVLSDESGSILHVEQDQIVQLEQCGTQVGAIWNLDRVSNDDYSSPDYHYGSHAGQGVHSYIIDTGIYIENDEFEGRAHHGANFVTGENQQDCNGHGTHVAGTVGGRLYGIAKKVTLYAVKVLGCDGSGSIAGIVDGMNWVVGHCTNKRKCNANMSLGGSRTTTLNNAATAMVQSGVTLVVAAGNSNADACSFSPASATGVVSVGATERYGSVGSYTTRRSTFSNFGTCVTVFAPGTAIKAAWIGSRTATNTISGTSMASPHVCGVASLIQATENLPPAEVTKRIQEYGQRNDITLNCGTNAVCSRSPNLFLHNPCN